MLDREALVAAWPLRGRWTTGFDEVSISRCSGSSVVVTTVRCWTSRHPPARARAGRKRGAAEAAALDGRRLDGRAAAIGLSPPSARGGSVAAPSDGIDDDEASPVVQAMQMWCVSVRDSSDTVATLADGWRLLAFQMLSNAAPACAMGSFVDDGIGTLERSRVREAAPALASRSLAAS